MYLRNNLLSIAPPVSGARGGSLPRDTPASRCWGGKVFRVEDTHGVLMAKTDGPRKSIPSAALRACPLPIAQSANRFLGNPFLGKSTDRFLGGAPATLQHLVHLLRSKQRSPSLHE